MERVRDVTGFEELYADAWEPVFRYAARRVGPDDALDVAASTFATAWRTVQSGADLPGLPWLIATARHHVSNSRRSARRRQALVAKVGATLDAAAPRSAWTVVDLEATRDLLEQIRRKLDDLDAEIVLLTAWEELSAPDIALVVGLSPDAVRARLSRARRRLRTARSASEEEARDAD